MNGGTGRRGGPGGRAPKAYRNPCQNRGSHYNIGTPSPSLPSPAGSLAPPMKLKSCLLLAVSALAWIYPAAHLAVAETAPSPAAALAPQPSQAAVDEAVAYVLTHYHYSREPLDAALSGRIFDEYLKELDGGHSYFLKADIASFAPYRAGLATSIKKGDLGPAFAMYGVFRQRFDERMAYVATLLTKQPD